MTVWLSEEDAHHPWVDTKTEPYVQEANIVQDAFAVAFLEMRNMHFDAERAEAGGIAVWGLEPGAPEHAEGKGKADARSIRYVESLGRAAPSYGPQCPLAREISRGLGFISWR